MEITERVELDVEEESLLDMHSIINLLNSINYELHTLAVALEDPPEILGVADTVADMGSALRDAEEAHRQVENVDTFVRSVQHAIERAAKAGADAETAEVIDNLQSLFDVLRLRAQEIVVRSEDPFGWVTHDIPTLRENFQHVFRAIERNSRGGYRIVDNLAQHGADSYYMRFDIAGRRGDRIRMPAVFQDVMRDLIANARKYTDPGGRILAGVYEDETELRFAVADTGRGIPEDEIPKLVQFGTRGSNVGDRPTRGGGFGLTKAYYITKKLGGRMWIESELHSGTEMRLAIPTSRGGELRSDFSMEDRQ